MNPEQPPAIMLVADDPEIAYLLGRYAFIRGWRVISISANGEIVAPAQLFQPAAIILGLLPCGESDPAILAALKANRSTCSIPVIVFLSVEMATDGWDELADGYLVKPVMYADFVAILDSALIAAPA